MKQYLLRLQRIINKVLWNVGKLIHLIFDILQFLDYINLANVANSKR